MFSKIKIFILLMFLIFPALGKNTNEAIFYHGIGCPHCGKVSNYLKEFQKVNSNFKFTELEIYHNRDNAIRLNKDFEKNNIPASERGVPALFVGDNYYIGDKPIIDFLESQSKTHTNNATLNKEEDKINIPKMSLVAIAAAALVDSINPCAIAVLVILLSALLLQKEKKKALFAGLSFTASVFIAYFLLGIGLVYTINVSGLSYWLYRIVGGIALLIGLSNIKDFFWYGKGFVMEIPPSWRPVLKKILRGVTSPLGAFFVGFVVMLFELPCTGGPYFFVIGLLSQSLNWSSIIPTLLYYNFVFVLPLILLTILIYIGLCSVEKIGAWKDKNIRILHLISGLIMMSLGIWIFIG